MIFYKVWIPVSQAESCCVTESSVNWVKLQTRIVTIKNSVPPNSFQAFGVPCDSDELLTGGGYLALDSGLEKVLSLLLELILLNRG